MASKFKSEPGLKYFTLLMPEIRRAQKDLICGLLVWRIWIFLGWLSIRLLYSRSFFGSMWITFSFGFFVSVKIFIMTRLFANNNSAMADYPLHIALGFLIFMFINSAVCSGPLVFVGAKNYIENGNIPLSAFVYKDLFREACSFGLHGFFVIALGLTVHQGLNITSLTIIPAIFILLLNGVWVKLMLGTIGARYRDIRHLLEAIMRVMLFLSPVLWMQHQVGNAIQVLWWNPIYHFIEIIRVPVIDGTVPFESWLFVVTCTSVGCVLAMLTYSLGLKKIYHWI